jgi:hypothetical protein
LRKLERSQSDVVLIEIVGSESHPVYQGLEIANGNRQYDFLMSIVGTSLAVQRPFLSSAIIKALNFQAITCLHTNAGEYRPCPVTVGDYAHCHHARTTYPASRKSTILGPVAWKCSPHRKRRYDSAGAANRATRMDHAG